MFWLGLALGAAGGVAATVVAYARGWVGTAQSVVTKVENAVDAFKK